MLEDEKKETIVYRFTDIAFCLKVIKCDKNDFTEAEANRYEKYIDKDFNIRYEPVYKDNIREVIVQGDSVYAGKYILNVWKAGIPIYTKKIAVTGEIEFRREQILT